MDFGAQADPAGYPRVIPPIGLLCGAEMAGATQAQRPVVENKDQFLFPTVSRDSWASRSMAALFGPLDRTESVVPLLSGGAVCERAQTTGLGHCAEAAAVAAMQSTDERSFERPRGARVAQCNAIENGYSTRPDMVVVGPSPSSSVEPEQPDGGSVLQWREAVRPQAQ